MLFRLSLKMEPPVTSGDDMSDSDDRVVTSCLPIVHSSPPAPSGGDCTLPSTAVKSIGTAFLPHHRKTHSLAPE